MVKYCACALFLVACAANVATADPNPEASARAAWALALATQAPPVVEPVKQIPLRAIGLPGDLPGCEACSRSSGNGNKKTAACGCAVGDPCVCGDGCACDGAAARKVAVAKAAKEKKEAVAKKKAQKRPAARTTIRRVYQQPQPTMIFHQPQAFRSYGTFAAGNCGPDGCGRRR